MSPLVLLGASATVLSTVTLLPHLVHALRAGRPGGSTTGWTLGFLSSLAWCLYGLGAGDAVVAAPGLITLPVGAALAVWCFVAGRGHRVPVGAVRDLRTSPAMLTSLDAGDTLELPRIA